MCTAQLWFSLAATASCASRTVPHPRAGVGGDPCRSAANQEGLSHALLSAVMVVRCLKGCCKGASPLLFRSSPTMPSERAARFLGSSPSTTAQRAEAVSVDRLIVPAP